ncbi:uncharacterized protein KRP23_6836 [Phytophthora ramorum]|uniref:uncharacterized protein n=1 Tax=Phytophthora ramorum TaxID=164328 RepID=UPI003099F24B|nr:hypothetical protein KRP23_6836 [Phytophthora ramorum]
MATIDWTFLGCRNTLRTFSGTARLSIQTIFPVVKCYLCHMECPCTCKPRAELRLSLRWLIQLRKPA